MYGSTTTVGAAGGSPQNFGGTVSMGQVAVPMPPGPPKPGLKSTEFWLSLAVTIAAFLIPALGDSEIAKIAGQVVAALTAAGYSLSRGKAKAGG